MHIYNECLTWLLHKIVLSQISFRKKDLGEFGSSRISRSGLQKAVPGWEQRHQETGGVQKGKGRPQKQTCSSRFPGNFRGLQKLGVAPLAPIMVHAA